MVLYHVVGIVLVLLFMIIVAIIKPTRTTRFMVILILLNIERNGYHKTFDANLERRFAVPWIACSSNTLHRTRTDRQR